MRRDLDDPEIIGGFFMALDRRLQVGFFYGELAGIVIETIPIVNLGGSGRRRGTAAYHCASPVFPVLEKWSLSNQIILHFYDGLDEESSIFRRSLLNSSAQ